MNMIQNEQDYTEMLKIVSPLTLQKESDELTVSEMEMLVEFFDIMCGNPDTFRHYNLISEIWNDYLSK